MLDSLMTYGSYVLLGLGAVAAALTVIAPLTSSNLDNKALDAIRWVEKALHLLMPKAPVAKVAGEAPAAQPVGKGK